MEKFKPISFIQYPDGKRELKYGEVNLKVIGVDEEKFEEIRKMSFKEVKDLIDNILDNIKK